MLRVFIVDDHPVVIEGIHSLLLNEKDIAWGANETIVVITSLVEMIK